MIYQFEEFELDTRNFQLRRSGIAVEVEPKVFDLLNFLIVNRERLATRDELFRTLWPGQVVSDASLSNQIKSARTLIGDNGQAQRCIKTMHGRGYQFIASTRELTAENLDVVSIEEPRSNNPSIAVIPFTNLSNDPGKDYLSNGIAEDITTQLCRFRELLVINRGSSIQIKRNPVDIETVSSQLGAQYFLEGSVRATENRMRVNVQLTDTIAGNHIWAESYDRELLNEFDTQDDITQLIVATVARCLEQSGWETALKKKRGSHTVYDLLLRARHSFSDWPGTQEEIVLARKLYEKAAELDPNCAAAYSGIASTYNGEYLSLWTDDQESAGQNAFKFARKALTLDNRDSNAHLVLASAHRDITANFDLAFQHIDKAIDANPNDYWIYCCKSFMLIINGEFREGISCSRQAVRRNPLLPDTCLEGIGYAEYFSKHYKRALVSFCNVLTPKPKIYAYIAACYAQLCQNEEALTAAVEFRKQNKENPMIERPADADCWCDYWIRVCHFTDLNMQNHLLDGLRKCKIIS